MELMLFSFLLLTFFLSYVTAEKSDEGCLNGVCLAFKSYGLAADKTFYSDPTTKHELSLVSAGMRRKNVIVMEVDVYKVGIYLSESKDAGIHEAATKMPLHGDDIVIEIEKPAVRSSISVGISLNFVRDVQTDKVVSAIIQAMVGPGDEYNKALQNFSDILLSAIGADGMKNNSVLSLTFHGKDGLSISIDDKFVGSLTSGKIRLKLIEIYLGPKPLAPAVVEVIKARYN